MKRWLAALAACMAMWPALAAVNINKADLATLDGVKGIGPKTAQAIVDARTSGGHFTDWDDFKRRVKGIGDKRAASFSAAGLVIDGATKSSAATAAEGPAEADCIDDRPGRNKIVTPVAPTKTKPAAPVFVDVPGKKPAP